MRPSIRSIGTTPLMMAGVLVVLIVLFRTLVSGWGPPAAAATEGVTRYGLAGYPADNLSYVSWAAQAREGRWLFEILYTTSPHGRFFFNPLFLAIGGIASFLDTSPLLVLNVLAIFSLPIVVLCFWHLCRSMQLSTGAGIAATCLALGGAGFSWVRWGVDKAGLGNVLPVGPLGPDQSFYDVYPIVAYFLAPYHAIALAIVAALMATVVALDDPEHPITKGRLALLAALAVLLATVRPHIAIMFCLAYGAAVTGTILWRASMDLIHRRLVVLVSLAVTIVPPVLYSLWISQQPIWMEYARAHPAVTDDWAVGFFLLWILAGAGLSVLGSRTLHSRYAFPAAWAVVAATLLLGLNGFIYPKLTYGVTLAMALLAGAAVDRVLASVRSRAVMAAVVAGVSAVALASPILQLQDFTPRSAPRTSVELFQAAETIRRVRTAPVPTVLADCGTGVLLPGLAGVRVFCGHWALTDHNREKIVLLSRLGFLADGAAVPTFPDLDERQIAADSVRLRDQVRSGTFDYVVVRAQQRVYGPLISAGSGCTLQKGEDYAVLSTCPAVRAKLDEILSSAEME
ncbi:MAG TPA: hypothetical protein VGD94_01095 [Vicinamibacterales bacterium]